MSNTRVGFSMHPRWTYGTTLMGFLEPLRAAGLKALEFGLDVNDADWPRFEPLMDECQRLGFDLCFHAPYRRPYTISGFSGRERARIADDYAPMLEIAARFGPAAVVIHGACSATRRQEKLRADTVAFLRWALERYPSLTLALENLTLDANRIKIGANSRPELSRIVGEIEAPRLGICWDLGHDVVNDCYDLPDKTWLRRVCHVHLHDVSEQGVDHYPLMYGRVPYQLWLPALVETGFEGIVTMELKGGQLAFMEPPRIMEILAKNVAEIHGMLIHPGEERI